MIFTDAKQQFKNFDKKSAGRVNSKDLGKVFKALGLTVSDEKIKSWSDEMDDDGKLKRLALQLHCNVIKVLITIVLTLRYLASRNAKTISMSRTSLYRDAGV